MGSVESGYSLGISVGSELTGRDVGSLGKFEGLVEGQLGDGVGFCVGADGKFEGFVDGPDEIGWLEGNVVGVREFGECEG